MSERPPPDAQGVIERYCAKLPSQLEALNALVDRALERKLGDNDANRAAVAEAHRMSGAAHCLGFQHLGDLLGALEAALLEAADTENRLQTIGEKMAAALSEGRATAPDKSSLFKLDLNALAREVNGGQR